MFYAEIAVDTYQDPTKKLFTYQIPEGLKEEVSEGTWVVVPFGKRTVEGFIWKITSKKPPFPTKAITEVKGQAFNPSQMKLAFWMFRHYLAAPLECLRCQTGKKGEQEKTAPTGKIDTLILVPYTSQVKIKALASQNAGERALIGSRSAVFAQLPNLKKIVVEEPENWNYKDERTPYYHTLQIARKRAEIEDLELELKPSVPSVEHFAEDPSDLPTIKPPKILDLTTEKAAGNYTLISQELERKVLPAKTLIIYASSKELLERVKEDLQKKMARKSSVEIFGPELFSIPAKEADYIFWVDTDTLLNLPDFRAHEKLVQTVQKLEQRAKSTLYLQTLAPNHPLMLGLSAGNLENFYQRELEVRKELGYPPFSTLVKLTYTSRSTAKTSLEAERLYEKISEIKDHKLSIDISPPYEPYLKTPRKMQLNIAIKIKSRSNIDRTLDKISKVIPTDWRIVVDPESLL